MDAPKLRPLGRRVGTLLCVGGVVCLLVATYLLSLHWSSAGLVSQPPVDVITCDSVIRVIVDGEHEYATVGDGVGSVPADPQRAEWCLQGSRAPGVAGITAGAVGSAAIIAGVITLARRRAETGQKLPDVDSNQEPID